MNGVQNGIKTVERGKKITEIQLISSASNQAEKLSNLNQNALFLSSVSILCSARCKDQKRKEKIEDITRTTLTLTYPYPVTTAMHTELFLFLITKYMITTSQIEELKPV